MGVLQSNDSTEPIKNFPLMSTIQQLLDLGRRKGGSAWRLAWADVAGGFEGEVACCVSQSALDLLHGT